RPAPARRAGCGSRARSTGSARATCCTSASTSEPGVLDRANPLTGLAIEVKIAGCFTGMQLERPEGYPSGQRGQTVNLLAYAFGGSNPPPSTSSTAAIQQLQRCPSRE